MAMALRGPLSPAGCGYADRPVDRAGDIALVQVVATRSRTCGPVDATAGPAAGATGRPPSGPLDATGVRRCDDPGSRPRRRGARDVSVGSFGRRPPTQDVLASDWI